MINDESAVADRLPEPPDDTRLVVRDRDGEYKVIWRNDAEARRWGDEHATQRWFAHPDEDPMDLYQHVKYAETVYALPAEPLAQFRS